MLRGVLTEQMSLSEVYREGSNFTKVEQNYRAFNRAGGRSNWQFIVFEHNEHQLEQAKAQTKDSNKTTSS